MYVWMWLRVQDVYVLYVAKGHTGCVRMYCMWLRVQNGYVWMWRSTDCARDRM